MIWIDLSTAPDPLFFRPLVRRLGEQGHDTWITAREYGETTAIAAQCGLGAEVVGRHGGSSLAGKALAIGVRALRLSGRAGEMRPAAAVSFNSYAQAIAARHRRIPFVTITDYEHQPANHLAFRLAAHVIVPAGFDADTLRRQGADPKQVTVFEGLKEDVSVGDFDPDPAFRRQLQAELEIDPGAVLVTMRPPATASTYHRFHNDFFYAVVQELASRPGVVIVVLPRYPAQADRLRGLGRANIVIPDDPVDGLNLVFASDLVVSAGGSMNREAAALGTPAYTLFAGTMAGVDHKLMREGRLTELRDEADVRAMVTVKKQPRPARPRGRAADRMLEAVLAALELPAR